MEAPERDPGAAAPAPSVAAALVMLWSRTEPRRAGECAFLPRGGDLVLGRSPNPVGATALPFVQQRPRTTTTTGLLEAGFISREQWRMRHTSCGALEIENVGRRPLVHNGVVTRVALARFGDVLEIADEAVFMLSLRPARLPAGGITPDRERFGFGQPDEFGIIGESPAAWHHRRQLALAAMRCDHVLLIGPSGVGKELAARAIHGLSARRRHSLIARNAATLPESLIDAELFGNAKDFPNIGTPERQGLIGAADGSTLFLDEIGELSHALQAHLLRVLDGGEYHRLGECRARRAEICVVAATNRSADELKHDLAPRLTLRLAVPPLDQRREDIPLIARHLLQQFCAGDRHLAESCFVDGDLEGHPRWDARTITALVRGSYHANVRDLQHVVRQAAIAADERGPTLEPRAAAHECVVPSAASVDPRAITASQLKRALAQCGGSREKAWRALGLRNRHQIMRLLRRFEGEIEPGTAQVE